MNTPARLLSLGTARNSYIVAIQPYEFWINKCNFSSWIIGKNPKHWADFLYHSCSLSGPPISISIISGRVVADLLEAGLADGEFLPLEIRDSSVHYFAFHPRAVIQMREVDVAKKRGYSEPAFASAPDYNKYLGHAFALGQRSSAPGRENFGHILCIPAIMELARAKKWTGVEFSGFDGSGTLYECNVRGKILRDSKPALESIIDGYYVKPEEIVADLVRARQLAAELQTSLDTPEWTRRSFEIVRKALAEAPHTLGYPVPESSKPRRIAREVVPLIDPKDIKRLKLEGDGEYTGEIPLSRSLFGSDTLSVVVSDEIFDDDAPEVTFTKTELKRRTQAALESLESCLPTIEGEIEKLVESYKQSADALRAELQDPSLMLCTADLSKGDRWTFILEGEPSSHHFEFDGLRLIETWSGD